MNAAKRAEHDRIAAIHGPSQLDDWDHPDGTVKGPQTGLSIPVEPKRELSTWQQMQSGFAVAGALVFGLGIVLLAVAVHEWGWPL